jgi:X-Pro dipeptidyl-peptidase
MSHGFNDWNVMPEHSNRIYQAAKDMGLPVQIYYHQGGHGGPPPLEMMNKWFTHFLYDVENGVEEEPKAWIVREGDLRSQPTPYADFPNPAAEPVALHLRKGGSAAGRLSLKKPRAGRERLVDDVAFSGADLARASASNHRLLYVTPVLKEAVHLSGLATVRIRLASSKPAANLSVWLVSLPWDSSDRTPIYHNIITRGWADPQNHESLRSSEPLVPGTYYSLSFDLQPDDQVIPAGQQIGLMIFSSDPEFTLHPEAGTELTIDLKNTELLLPIVGGKKAFKSAW